MAAKKKKTDKSKKQPARRGAPASKPGAAKPARKAASKVPLVSDFMTRSPHTVGRDQPLATAHALMNKHRIRHLPVLDGGQLVGLVSQRDLYFVETLDGTPPASITVDEAMSQEVFETGARTLLADVVDTMVRKKLGCAVVVEKGKVAGVFSTIDGLNALLQYVPR